MRKFRITDSLINLPKWIIWVLVLSVLFVISFLVVFASYINLKQNAIMERDTEQVLSVQRFLGDLSTDFYRSVSDARLFLITQSDADLQSYLQYKEATYATLAQLVEVIDHSGLTRVFPDYELSAFNKNMDDKYLHLQKVIALRRQGRDATTELLNLEGFRNPIQDIESQIDRWSLLLREVSGEKQEQTHEENVKLNRMTSGGVIGVILFLIGISLLLARALTRSRSLTVHLAEESERLSKAEKVKSEFLANMSHEIRTPMNAILGFSELMKDAQDDPQRLSSYIKGISTSGQALLGLINDILDLSRIEAGQMNLHYSMVDIRNLIEEVRLVFGEQFKRKSLGFDLKILDTLPGNLFLDVIRIRQILFNLIGNAVKFTQEGQVSVRISFVSGEENPGLTTLVMVVEDTGIGIPQESLDTIFEPFRQVESNHSRQYKGTGLGLSICKKLAEAMGGSLEVKSREGRGSVFTVTIPNVQFSPLPISPADSLTEEMKPLRFAPSKVLVVEDDAFNRQVLSDFLTPAGLTIKEAENGRIALSMVEQECPDLILMDLQMPQLSGVDAIREIRKNRDWDNCPIIMLTASYVSDEDKKELATLTQGRLEKPVSRTALMETLSRFLEKSPVEEAGPEPDISEDDFLKLNHDLETLKGRSSSIIREYLKEVAPLITEAGATFSIKTAAMAGQRMITFGNKYKLKSFVALGNTLTNSAAVVDAPALKAALNDAGKLGDSVSQMDIGESSK